MRNTIQKLQDRLEQAELELAFLKTRIDIKSPEGSALHRAVWAVRDSYKDAVHIRAMTNTAKGDEPMPPMPNDS